MNSAAWLFVRAGDDRKMAAALDRTSASVIFDLEDAIGSSVAQNVEARSSMQSFLAGRTADPDRWLAIAVLSRQGHRGC